jgi:hypothetical protein
MAKNPSYIYGKHPNPTNWHETADTLKNLKSDKPKPTSGGLMDRLRAIESTLKVKK